MTEVADMYERASIREEIAALADEKIATGIPADRAIIEAAVEWPAARRARREREREQVKRLLTAKREGSP